MQIHGQMERVPVTAHQKFSEAAYIYNAMLPHRTNPVVCPYYLSAFVSALRSVTFYLQKQYARDPAFTAWYETKQQEMRADHLLKVLVERRNTALHIEPFDLCFKQGWKMPEPFVGVIRTTFLAFRAEADREGRVRTFLHVEKDGPEEEVETQISWHFTDNDPTDVMQYCYEGLEKMHRLFKELAALGLEQCESRQ